MSQHWSSNCNSSYRLLVLILVVHLLRAVHAVNLNDVDADLRRLLGRCDTQSKDFNDCMRQAMNDMRLYYKTGIPAYHIKPFEPHHVDFVKLRRGFDKIAPGFISFDIILRNVSEHGWSFSRVTKFEANLKDQRIVFSQYFPEKKLEGLYEYSGKMLGTEIKRAGPWNLTLNDIRQTTTIERPGGPGSRLKVLVEIDHIGKLEVHAENLLGPSVNWMADMMVNAMWQIGMPLVKPVILELMSTAFTDIFNESFRYFPFEKFLTESPSGIGDGKP